VFVGVDDTGRFAHQDLHRVLVAQPIRTFDRIEEVQLEAVGRFAVFGSRFERACVARAGRRPHVSQGGGDAALRRAAVRAQRVNLGENPDILDAALRRGQRPPRPGQPGADDEDVVLDHVRFHQHQESSRATPRFGR
jgi:hypothetical protein